MLYYVRMKKVIMFSNKGKVRKIRRSRAQKRSKVIWGKVEVPRDEQSKWILRPYPVDETGYGNGKERQLRRYARSTGESKVKGKRVVVIAYKSQADDKVVVRLLKESSAAKKARRNKLHKVAHRRKTHKAYSPAQWRA